MQHLFQWTAWNDGWPITLDFKDVRSAKYGEAANG